jgi:hypothetical protein
MSILLTLFGNKAGAGASIRRFYRYIPVPLLCISGLLGAASGSKSTSEQLEDFASDATVQNLSIKYNRIPHDFPARAVYAVLRCKLRIANCDVGLLSALPKNGKEMEEFYDRQGANEQYPLVSRSFSDFYAFAAKAVVRHPEYLPSFLTVISEFNSKPVDNVDERTQLCEAARYMYARRPSEYTKAVTRIAVPYRATALKCREGSAVP